MDRQEFLKEIKHLAKPSTVKVVTLFLIILLSVMGVVVINNVNKELKIREIASKFQQFKYSIRSFSNVYSGLPGDLGNATFYWKDETSNGNGDGKIELEDKEAILAWQHLQLAKLLRSVKKKLNPVWADNIENKLSSKNNSPNSEIDNSLFYIKYVDQEKINQIVLSREKATGGYSEKNIITPKQSYMLDLMIDDGYPDVGSLKAMGENENDCKLAGEYKDLEDSIECYLIFDI